jgi:histidinol dehydrogenase
MPVSLNASAPDFDEQLRALLDRRRDEEDDAERIAAEIIRRIRLEGDAAVIDYTRRFDRLELSPARLRIGAEEIAAAVSRCDGRELAALALARDRIEDYHRRQLPPMPITATRQACASAGAGGRSRQSASMCRAAPPPIRARC